MTQSYGLLQAMLQVRIYEGDIDFASPGSAAAGSLVVLMCVC